MKVYTDSTEFADLLLSDADWSSLDSTGNTPTTPQICRAVFGERPLFEAEVQAGQRWRYLLVAESSERSQYDLLIEQRRQGVQLPDGLLCLSGAGKGLHGLRNRPWAAEAGNIHLSVHLLPGIPVAESGIPFMVLAAISVVDAIDSVPEIAGKARVKWVNDILLEDAKVAGVLAYTEGTGRSIEAAVLGIGLNVETTPDVEGTPFVPKVGSLRDYVPDAESCVKGRVFDALNAALSRNYQVLLDGRGDELIERYRQRSVVIGRYVKVCVDDASSPPKTIAAGRVDAIGDNLELHLAGVDEPVTRGRLILDSEV